MLPQSDNVALSTYQVPYKAPLLASLILILTLLQGSSFTLTLAVLSPFANDTLSSLVTLAWLSMYALATIGLLTSFGLNWVTWLVRYRLPLICLVAGAALSTIWSVDTHLTIERSVHLIGTTLVALYLGFSLPLTRLLRVSGMVLGLLMLASVIAALQFPTLGLENYEGQQVWRGVMASKNTLGFWSAISILLLLSISTWSAPAHWRLFYIGLAAVSAVCLYYSVSATSALALVCSSVIMMYLYFAFSLRLGLIAMIVLGLLVVSLVGIAFYYIDTAELIGRSGDLTGRGAVWTQTWKLILDRPLTGFGYGTIWYPTDESVWIQQSLTDFSWIVYHAHNGLLQIASEIGLPLTALALIMIIQQLIEIVYCQYQRQQPGVLFVLGFTVALIISNYSEARLLIHRELYWVLFITLPISMLQQVTLLANNSGFNPVPVNLPARDGEKLRLAREKLAQRRTLKKRLRSRRAVTVVNEKKAKNLNDKSTKNQTLFSSIEQTDSQLADRQKQQHSRESEANKQIDQINGTQKNVPMTFDDSEQSLKQKLARQQNKAG